MTRRMLGSMLIGMLACAPTRATTAPPASAEVPAPAGAAATTEVSSDGAKVAGTKADGGGSQPIAMTGDVVIDVGNGQSLKVGEHGKVTLDDVVLQPVEDESRVHGYHLTLTRDDATLTLGLGDGPRVTLFRVLKVDLEQRRLRWHALMGPNLGMENEPVNWRVLEARNRMMIVEDERVVAIDTRSGAQAWAFWLLAPEFRREYLTTILPTLVQFHIDDARVRGRELVLSARLGEDREPSMLEIDVDSGRRVYVEGRRDAPEVTKLDGFGAVVITVHTAVRDDPPPPPPPKPLRVEGWDAVAVGTTLLVWNVRTKRGLVLNPMHDTLAEVLAQARALPVQWVGVVDTKAVADAIVASGAKFPLVKKPSAAEFDYGLVAADSLDFVDAAAVARSLEVPAITTPKALPKDATIRFERKPDVYTSIRLVWGPFAFQDSNRPTGYGNYVTLL